jgi:hypothetical protein
VELIKDFEGKVSKDKDLIKFKRKYNHSDLEDVMSYNEILDYVEREYNNEDGHHLKFRTSGDANGVNSACLKCLMFRFSINLSIVGPSVIA